MSSNWMPGVAALMGLALAAPVSAEAHDIREMRGRDRGRDYRYEGRAGGVGFEKGYEDGLKHGRKDGDRRETFEFTHDKHYRQGDHGYRSEYGPRFEYVRGYRRGYEEGYRDGYEGYFSRDGHGRRGYGRYGPDGRIIYEIPRY
jgi:hypothetical protein